MTSLLFKFKNTLFWKIALLFTVILIILGLAYSVIIVRSANQYYQETTQKLNANVATLMLDEINPFEGGSIKKEDLGKLMHSMMAVNPNLEIYLLDPKGKILEYVVLKKKVKLNYVDLKPVKTFIKHQGERFILGDDPKSAGEQKIFSAAEVRENGKLKGFVYMILASEEYENAAETLWNSYILKLGINTFLITLIAALAIGLLVLWLLTRNLTRIISTLQKFEEGDLSARMPVSNNDELSQLSRTFNRMADTILHNIEELKNADSLRKELIANVSHDLRNPLSIIHGYMETLVLKRDELSAEDEIKFQHIILNNTGKLKNLVSSLFELSKLEARQIKPHKEPFAIAELLQDISGKYYLSLQAKNIHLKTNFPETGAMVYADLSMMERVLQNLLENAIKFTPEKESIEVSVKTHQDNLEVSILNTGIGIPQDELDNIFDRYYKSSDTLNEGSGTGLGLAIVKNILELHDSIIEVKSEVKKFTRFYFKIPVYQFPT